MTESPVPLTLISGFIGAGKSTLLKQLVENKAGLKVGILVESVEEVSIDEALVSKKSTSAIGDTVELQNGCACSSAAQDFAEGIKQLMTLAKERGVPWDHIVIESSGVAEPREARTPSRRPCSAPTTLHASSGGRAAALATASGWRRRTALCPVRVAGARQLPQRPDLAARDARGDAAANDGDGRRRLDVP